MHSSDLARGFESFLVERGLAVETLDVDSAIEVVVAFYVRQRLEDVDLESDGDGLLFQWGTNGWGDGPAFTIDLTRQTTALDGDGDDDIWQLHLTLDFDPFEETAALGSGDQWCWSPDDVPSFREAVQALPCVAYGRTHTARRVELDHENAG